MKIKNLLIILSVGIFLGVSYTYFNHKMILTQIKIELKKEPKWEVSTKEIHHILQSKLKKFIGQKIWNISFKEIITILKSEPHVGTIKILRIFPNHLFIRIYARTPLLLLLNSKNDRLHPLSIDGLILPALSANKIPNLPILRGRFFLQKIKNRQMIIQFLKLIPKQGKFSHSEISEILYSKKQRSVIFILSKNGKLIKVGNKPQKMKTKRIESVLRYLDQKNINWRVIDTRFSQKIVVSTAKAI